jgi:hypothetical protein
MRKLIGFLMLFLAAAACRDPLLDSHPRFMREQDRFARDARKGEKRDRDSLLKPDVPHHVPSLYATAFHFRDSVNWRKDSLGRVDLLFFKDGEQVLQVPVDSPPDPERHRIWDGHLWSDSTDGRETVILCDGKEQFRFDGEEHLQGFLLLNGDVHTLGQRPGRGGFCYRINGQAVFESASGSVLGSPSDPQWRGGALAVDEGDVFYAFKDGRYQIMQGGEPFHTLSGGSANTLLDIRVHRKTPYWIERRGTSLFWIAGEKETYLNLFAPSVVSCQLIPYGDTLTVRGRTQTSGPTSLNWFYIPSSHTIRHVFNGQSVRGQGVLLNDYWVFADLDADGNVLQLAGSHEWPPIPSGEYQLTTPLDLFMSETHRAAALTDATGQDHVILSDLGRQSYSFNGYFTSVRIE